MRTSNPALKAFTKREGSYASKPMTLMGAINKSFLLLFILITAAGAAWYYSAQGQDVTAIMIGGAIGGFIVALIVSFVPKTAPVLAPVYAVLEGMFVGGISAYYASLYEGIVMQAVLLTASVFLALLLAYRSRLIKVTRNFRLGVIAATGGIMIMYLLSFVLSFFGVTVPFLHDASPIGILISVAIVIVAALNLVLDFDFIENGSKAGLPKHMEWYAGFALLVTLVWLYLEILRLLAKLRRN
ncbi:Bax inhibitor-1/YccA family protein [Metabacillus idriensis]|uniref:Bax inhibitor-1/YccA family protein n=1 Tax=Metabacillus idriensis TaxID=324768 RepID=UPI003D29BF3B